MGAAAAVDELLDIASPLPACGDLSRAFHREWPVRLGDTDGDERLRLDAVARYLQDIGCDHLLAVEEGDLHPGWIVRRTVIDVLAPIGFGDRVHLRRWPSALSNRWCNMRIQVRSEDGGLIETEMFLVHVDIEAGRPARMSDRFMAPMLATTTEHRLRWRAALRESTGVDADTWSFPLRVADVDRYGHVNNAVHWAAVEEALARFPDAQRAPYRVILEHAGPVMAGDDVQIRAWRDATGLCVQLEVDGGARTLARIESAAGTGPGESSC
ncbi:acyl-[acyl-carrier-protein] thioesterase [Nocardia sp. NEAU-G5]|uniref:Acyl-[acyl-carrier-protein] thioesterase n=1 Tax=Nocardia albiluteola TaxID=2842303 RepID=A0ABS6B673_9NOCA|nr:acyl-ACP thioesterase domain-containing protein [Nocardia albiluteola]MBU3064901.1 acyl-[acyl-carrier-protein] thioesterase [Nocardia albiluteola]